jgi:hypothetical protein
MAVLLAGICCRLEEGQATTPTTLVVDLANLVEYQDATGDPAKLATNSKLTPSTTFKTFGVVTIIGNIVALNGQPARGA